MRRLIHLISLLYQNSTPSLKDNTRPTSLPHSSIHPTPFDPHPLSLLHLPQLAPLHSYHDPHQSPRATGYITLRPEPLRFDSQYSERNSNKSNRSEPCNLKNKNCISPSNLPHLTVTPPYPPLPPHLPRSPPIPHPLTTYSLPTSPLQKAPAPSLARR